VHPADPQPPAEQAGSFLTILDPIDWYAQPCELGDEQCRRRSAGGFEIGRWRDHASRRDGANHLGGTAHRAQGPLAQDERIEASHAKRCQRRHDASSPDGGAAGSAGVDENRGGSASNEDRGALIEVKGDHIEIGCGRGPERP